MAQVWTRDPGRASRCLLGIASHIGVLPTEGGWRSHCRPPQGPPRPERCASAPPHTVATPPISRALPCLACSCQSRFWARDQRVLFCLSLPSRHVCTHFACRGETLQNLGNGPPSSPLAPHAGGERVSPQAQPSNLTRHPFCSVVLGLKVPFPWDPPRGQRQPGGGQSQEAGTACL